LKGRKYERLKALIERERESILEPLQDLQADVVASPEER
jgi:hypothetical protein